MSTDPTDTSLEESTNLSAAARIVADSQSSSSSEKPQGSSLLEPSSLEQHQNPLSLEQSPQDPSLPEQPQGPLSLEYIALKKVFADFVDLLAGNAPVITPLNNHLFSSGLIANAVHVTVETTGLTPYNRANKLIDAVLATLKSHPNPNSLFTSLITALYKVGLIIMAAKLMECFSKCK